MLLTILILIMTDVLTDWFVNAALIIIPLAASAILGSRVAERLKYRPMTTKEFLSEWNPFRKGFFIMKLLMIYVCDTWFIMIGIACIIEQILILISRIFLGRKRG